MFALYRVLLTLIFSEGDYYPLSFCIHILHYILSCEMIHYNVSISSFAYFRCTVMLHFAAYLVLKNTVLYNSVSIIIQLRSLLSVE